MKKQIIVSMGNNKVLVPPIKCQGIKTKIVPFIKEKLEWDGTGVWIEPFVGTGVVAFNIAPQRAYLCDKNQYIIALYQGIQSGVINTQIVREFLEVHGEKLEQYGADYYKEMRDKFNENGDPLFFLFLNRSDFNGMIRFNRHGKFNVPFCQKPNRFAKAYVTKICNQIAIAAGMMSVCEAIITARKTGLDEELVLKTLSGGAAGSFSLSSYGPRILKGDFNPGFYVKHFVKDMKIAIDVAKECDLKLPGLELALKLYEKLIEQGDGDLGTQALFKLYLS